MPLSKGALSGRGSDVAAAAINGVAARWHAADGRRVGIRVGEWLKRSVWTWKRGGGQ
jgi:hypothetical protein